MNTSDHIDSTLSRIVQEAGLVLIELDTKGVIQKWTDAAEALLGLAGSEAEGEAIYSLLPAAQEGAFRKMLDKAARGRRVRPFQSTLENREGKTLELRVSNAPIEREGERRPVGVYLILQDVTAQSRAEISLRQSTQQSRALFQTVPDAVILLSEEGTIESMNPAAENMFRYVGHEVIGRNVDIFVPSALREKYAGTAADFLRDEVGRFIGNMFEATARRRNDEDFPVEIAIAMIEAEGATTFAGVVRDISERKKQEELLRRLNSNLAEEVKERTRINDSLQQTLEELRTTQEHLIQSEKMASLGGMVAGVAHEINTPLGVGITASSVLATHTRQFLAKIDKGDVPESAYTQYAMIASESVKMLEANLQRAAELVKSFKQIAVDQTSRQKRRFCVKELIDETLMSLQPKLKRCRLKIETEYEDFFVIGHAGSFTQIMTNFIMNSIFHAYEDGEEGTLRICSHLEGNSLVLIYSDDGKGMDEEQQKKIFEPFFTTKRGAGGTGLGMHIVYNLVHQEAGGAIQVRSAPGEGTEFTVRLPVEPVD